MRGSKKHLNQIAKKPLKLEIKKLGNFDNEVIYADMERDYSFEVLKKIKGSF